MENRKCPQTVPLPGQAAPTSHLGVLRGPVVTTLWAHASVPSPEGPVELWLEPRLVGFFKAQLCTPLNPEVLPPALPLSVVVTVSTLGLLQLLIGNPQTSCTFPQLRPGLTPHSPGLPSLLSFSFWRGSGYLLSERRGSPFSCSPSPLPGLLSVATVALMVLVSLCAHSSLLP